MQAVVDEIKSVLPKKCIIYSFVRSIPQNRIKNLLRPDEEVFILKPNYTYNPNQSERHLKWNFTLDIVESLLIFDMVNLTNPMTSRNGKKKTNNY